MAADSSPSKDAPRAGGEPAEGAGEQPSGGGKKRLLFVLLAIVLAGGLGGGMAYSQFARLDRTAQNLLGEDASAEPAPIEYGLFSQIDGLVVNPAETGGARYLMVSVGFESEEAAVLAEIAEKDVVVRDAIIGLLSSKNVEALADIGYRDALKEEIRVLVNDILRKGEVDRLYFTQFMLQ